MASARKMDELLVSWLGSDAVYESILDLIENYKKAEQLPATNNPKANDDTNSVQTAATTDASGSDVSPPSSSGQSDAPKTVIPPFYPSRRASTDRKDEDDDTDSVRSRRRTPPKQYDSWEPLLKVDGVLYSDENQRQTTGDENVFDTNNPATVNATDGGKVGGAETSVCVRDQVQDIYNEVGQDPPLTSPSSLQSDDEDDDASIDGAGFATKKKLSGLGVDDKDGPKRSAEERLRRKYINVESFVRITKDICRFPSFFNVPLYQRILLLWNTFQQEKQQQEAKNEDDDAAMISPMEVVTYDMFEWFWKTEMEPFDPSDRFFRLVKQPANNWISRDDFLPFITQLLNDHPGLEFLSSHGEFQEKYAVTVITRIFYSVNKCHSGKITSRQIRRSDLLDAFHQVDAEEDINKVTRYFSYEHFYVLYCRFWELDHDRDYRINRDDLLKYGDHSLSHMIVDRIFDAAPRPFEQENPNHDFLSYESFIYFMLSEEDKSNEVSVRYWFTCVDVDGDGKLNNMEMRSFYAVQLHRMQCMGQEIVPFEDMLCQMMDMIKPKNSTYFIVDDFLQPECCNVSGALFDALFNLNKYLMFEQRDPFVERQKREDEFECDWDRFACIDYNRLAMEEEAREEEAMEIDWVTVDEDNEGGAGGATSPQGGGAAGGYAGTGGQGMDPAGGVGVSESPF